MTPLYIKQQVVSTSSPSSANVTNLRAVKLLYRIKHKDWMLQVLLLDLTNQSAYFSIVKKLRALKFLQEISSWWSHLKALNARCPSI